MTPLTSSGVALRTPPNGSFARLMRYTQARLSDLMFESLIFVKRAEAPAGVIAVVSRPRIGGRLQQFGRIEPIAGARR